MINDIARMAKLLSFKRAAIKPKTEDSTPFSFHVSDEYPDKPVMSAKFTVAGPHGKENMYSLLAPNLSKDDLKIAETIKSSVIREFLDSGDNPSANRLDQARHIALEGLSGYTTSTSKELLAYLIAHETFGHGPFSILMDDSEHIEEIVVNSPESNIYVYHSSYGYCKTNMKFSNEKSFRYTLNKLIEATEKEVNAATPVIDAQLPDGSRLHAQIQPYSINGTSATIRLPGSTRLDVRELIKHNTADPGIFSYLWIAMESGANIIITGAPSSGKTTMLSSLVSFVPYYRRIITIEEDVNEIKLDQNGANCVALQGRTTEKEIHVKEQVINALHMRPDLLIVGEMRGEEAREVFFGANVGVQFITTMHSNLDKVALISRLSTKPMSVEPQSLCMLDLAIFMKSEGLSDRRIEKIVEYSWHARGEIQTPESLGEPFEAREIVSGGALNHEELRNSKIVSKYSFANMMSNTNVLKELKKRATFLEALNAPANSGASAATYIRKYGAIS